QHITCDPIMAEKGGFKHFMLKEIYEQPRAVRETAVGRTSLDSGRVFLEEMEITEAEFKAADKINVAACGTSWHAGLMGKFMIAREAAGTIYTHAGPEIGVASTKAFTAQLTALFLLAVYLGKIRGVLTAEDARKHMMELNALPSKLEALLTHAEICEDLAKEYQRAQDFLFLGRGIHYPVALEGALKLKEISYIHAEGYPAGEMKHGPNALIDENLPVVIIATRDPADRESVLRYEKTLSNVKEVKARSGRVIVVANQGDHEIAESVDHVIPVPQAPELLSPILEVVPLQLLAYHIAVRRGCDVDQPRNLAKSVTVE